MTRASLVVCGFNGTPRWQNRIIWQARAHLCGRCSGMSRTRSRSLRAMTRKPSCLMSCSQSYNARPVQHQGQAAARQLGRGAPRRGQAPQRGLCTLQTRGL
jgi:hypothetical protein